MKKTIQKAEEQLYKLLSNTFTEQEVIDLFWNLIEDIYSLALKRAKELAGTTDPIPLAKLKALTWDGAADKTEARIHKHLEPISMDRITRLTKLTIGKKETQQSIFSLLVRLFENEVRVVYNSIIAEKASNAWFEIIADDCCEDCRDLASKTYPASDMKEINLLFHPDCDCDVRWMTKEERDKLGY